MNGLVPVLYGCTKNQLCHSNIASRINYILSFPEKEMITDEKKWNPKKNHAEKKEK